MSDAVDDADDDYDDGKEDNDGAKRPSEDGEDGEDDDDDMDKDEDFFGKCKKRKRSAASRRPEPSTSAAAKSASTSSRMMMLRRGVRRTQDFNLCGNQPVVGLSHGPPRPVPVPKRDVCRVWARRRLPVKWAGHAPARRGGSLRACRWRAGSTRDRAHRWHPAPTTPR